MDNHASTQGTVLLTGATGMVGRALSVHLLQHGYRVVGLLRPSSKEEKLAKGVQPFFMDISNPKQTDLPRREALGQLEGVVHLAGESIMGRWTDSKKQRIYHSRVEGTRKLAELLCGLERTPRVYVSASAVGIYGKDNGDTHLMEDAPHGHDFLAQVCEDWEAASDVLAHAGIRCAYARFGVILAREGGAFPTMLPAFKLGIAGKLGNGQQWMSWVHLADVVGSLHHILVTPGLQGGINVVAPEAVTNATYTETLGKALNRPTVLPAPEFVLKTALGELAESLLLASQRCEPERLRESGYAFRYPTLEGALNHLIGSP
jgi:uncharacterized protein